MKAVFRTIFGDARNIGAVAALLAVAMALTTAGDAEQAGWILPPLVLAGVGWLAAR